MKNKLIIFIFLVLGLFAFAIFAYAADPVNSGTPAISVADSRQSNQGADIILLMDSSGSMKKTDPRNYRKDSARLFISLLSADDNVGIISFGDSAKSLIKLTPNTKKNRQALFMAVNKISSKELTTDITAAVKKGVEELQSSTRKNKILLLMSDGKIDLGDPKKEEASLDELMKLLPEVKKAGIKIYTIAFSELSDSKLLGDLADKTGGFFRYAAADKDIHIMFASMFEKIKSPDSVALEGDSFTIDKDVKEAVLLITKQPGTATMLMDPSGKKSIRTKSAKNIQWYGSDVFDMITIQQPAAGKWKVRLSSKEGNKIFVLTNLKLKSAAIENSVKKGDKVVVNAWLEKDDNRIIDKEVLGQVAFSAEVTGPDGKGRKIALAGKPAPDEGIYSGDFTADQTGDYTVKLIAESKTFNRTKDILFKAVEPPPPPAAPAQPVAAPPAAAESEIDWQIVSFVLAGMVLILMILALVFYVKSRKYKKFYTQGLTETPGSEMAAESESAEENKQPEETVPPLEISIPHIGEEVPAASETADQSARINNLLGIIDFQKKKIAELMLIKDVIESARLRLSTFPIKNREVQDKVRKVAESYGVKDEFNEPLGALEDDASELVSYLLVLEREESHLAEKFERWEEELKRLLEGEELAPVEKSGDSAGSSARVLELETKLSEMESQLMSKDRKIKSLEQQYEDIEKEYMILYQQQQKQQQEQPNI